jgi:hypothetical protein
LKEGRKAGRKEGRKEEREERKEEGKKSTLSQEEENILNYRTRLVT